MNDLDAPTPDESEPPFRSGFATLVGRPNVGKSTLLNKLLGVKVTIVSARPQTTRTEVRGVLHRPEAQIVFVDTPGIHRPRSPLGGVLNETAAEAARGADVVVLVLDATGPVGPGDAHIAGTIPPGSIMAVNKIDLAKPDQVVAQLAKAAELIFADNSVARESAEFVPIS
ncbi:MAG: GTPase, partial [Acidimicrobiales bacterium]